MGVVLQRCVYMPEAEGSVQDSPHPLPTQVRGRSVRLWRTHKSADVGPLLGYQSSA